MLDSLQEIGNFTGIRVASGDVVLLPADVVDLGTDVGTDDVVLLNLLQRQVRVVDANEDDTLLGGGFNDNSEIQFGYGDETIVVGVMGQIQWSLNTVLVGQGSDTIDAGVAVYSLGVFAHLR